MIRLIPLLFLLAACGVDGAPVRPSDVEERAPQGGILISGSASAGVSGSF